MAPLGELSPKVTERANVRTFYSEINCINRKVLSMKSNKQSTLNIKRQLGCVYTADFFSGLRITDAVWVALLAARGSPCGRSAWPKVFSISSTCCAKCPAAWWQIFWAAKKPLCPAVCWPSPPTC